MVKTPFLGKIDGGILMPKFFVFDEWVWPSNFPVFILSGITTLVNGHDE